MRLEEDSVDIARDVHDVFAFVSNVANDVLWHTTVVAGRLVFLRSVRTALKGSQGRITNLPRLDIRLGLMAAASNRKADEATIRAALPALLEGQRFDYRELDNAAFDPAWILAGFP